MYCEILLGNGAQYKLAIRLRVLLTMVSILEKHSGLVTPRLLRMSELKMKLSFSNSSVVISSMQTELPAARRQKLKMLSQVSRPVGSPHKASQGHPLQSSLSGLLYECSCTSRLYEALAITYRERMSHAQ